MRTLPAELWRDLSAGFCRCCGHLQAHADCGERCRSEALQFLRLAEKVPGIMEKRIQLGRVAVPLVLFDPDGLSHRRTEPPGWMKDLRNVEQERQSGALVTYPRGAGRLRVSVGSAVGPEAPSDDQAVGERLRVVGTGIFVGGEDEVPSRAWGRRRWNLWDWLFAAFLPLLGAFLVWLSRFDRELVWLFAVTSAAFVIMCIPVTWAVFRFGTDFAKRSGFPPKDRPGQIIPLPPGDYRVSFRPVDGDEGAVHVDIVPVAADRNA